MEPRSRERGKLSGGRGDGGEKKGSTKGRELAAAKFASLLREIFRFRARALISLRNQRMHEPCTLEPSLSSRSQEHWTSSHSLLEPLKHISTNRKGLPRMKSEPKLRQRVVRRGLGEKFDASDGAECSRLEPDETAIGIISPRF